WCDDDDDGGGVACVGGGSDCGGRLWLPEGVEARGGEWVWGSNRSGDKECFMSRSENPPENFSGGGSMAAGDSWAVSGDRKSWGGRRVIIVFVCCSLNVCGADLALFGSFPGFGQN
ncbi:hypothetical protein Tco_1060790, partial [Tanacetum coccineum]